MDQDETEWVIKWDSHYLADMIPDNDGDISDLVWADSPRAAIVVRGADRAENLRMLVEMNSGDDAARYTVEPIDAVADLRAKLAKAEAALVSVAYFVPLLDPMLDLVRSDKAKNHVVHNFVTHRDESWSLILQRDGGKTPSEVFDEALAAKARAEADAAAMRESAKLGWSSALSLAVAYCAEATERAAREALAELESGTAGAALLRELEAGRALAAYARNVRLMLPYVPENDRAVYEALETALADYDAARGAK